MTFAAQQAFRFLICLSDAELKSVREKANDCLRWGYPVKFVLIQIETKEKEDVHGSSTS